MSSLALQIVKIFEDKLFSIRSSSEGDLYDECGRHKLLEKLDTFIEENRPIQLLLPGFPCKSPNLKKVCGKLPDAGEYFALKYLNDLCQEISSFYSFGCELTIWSDGRVFEDLIGVSKEEICQYESLLKSYSLSMKHLQWDSMNNYIHDTNVHTLIDIYGTKTFSFHQWFNKSINNQKQFCHLQHFIKEDLQNLDENANLSEEQMKNKINLICESLIERNDALTNLLEIHYPNQIRLSVHQHLNNGIKFTIRFFNSISHQSSTLPTPWHNVLFINEHGHFILTPFHKLNLQSEYLPITFNEHLWAFVQSPSPTSTFKLSIHEHLNHFILKIHLDDQIDLLQINIHWINILIDKFPFLLLRQSKHLTNSNKFSQLFHSPIICKSLSDLDQSQQQYLTQTHLVDHHLSQWIITHSNQTSFPFI